VDDAGAVRDTLVKKQGVLRHALEMARATLEEAAAAARGDDALPEDPFGVAAGADKKITATAMATTTAGAEAEAGPGGGGGGNGAAAAAAAAAAFGGGDSHEDTAVGGFGSGSMPFRTSSLDLSSLAKALSPTQRSGGGGGGDVRGNNAAGAGASAADARGVAHHSEAEGAVEEEEDGGGAFRLADVLAAAAGLACMYGEAVQVEPGLKPIRFRS